VYPLGSLRYRPLVLDLLRQLPPPAQFRAEAGFTVRPDALIREIIKRDIPEPSVGFAFDDADAASRPSKRGLDDPAAAPTGSPAQRIKTE
jgi:hypothetical protein